MVAVIHTSKSFRAALNYNEQKVKEAKAECLLAANYPKDTSDLSFQQKLNRLIYLAGLNEQTKKSCLHISLNFEPKENLSREQFTAIAQTYMEEIGFGHQPYLVYQHLDAAHPHLHVVTTNIQTSGKGIWLHNLGRRRSEPARKKIEQDFGLVVASSKQLKESYTLQPVRIQYGKTDTKRAISSVLNAVIGQYKFTSLEELNAILKLYNVQADRGEPGSRLYARRGLVYKVLDENGKPIGTPIRASVIYSKPTIGNLESRYAQNELDRKPHRQRLRTIIDWNLQGKSVTLAQWITALKKESIAVIIRQNAQGVIYGLTYIDHKTRCVFNGSDLGKAYSAKAILERTVAISQGQSLHSVMTMPDEDTAIYPHRSTSHLLENILQQNFSQPPDAEMRSDRKKKKHRRPKL